MSKQEVKLNLSYKPKIAIGISALSGMKTFFVNEMDTLRHMYGDLIDSPLIIDTVKPVDFSRNALFARFLMEHPYATHLWIIDDDVLLPQESPVKLIENDLPIVSGIIVQKKPPFFPLMNVRVAPDSYRFAVNWDKEKRYIPVDAVGFGCMMVRRDVVQAIQPPWARTTNQSEDFWFCERAQQAGFPIVADQMVQCGHVGEYIYSLNDFSMYSKNEQEKSKTYNVTVVK